MTCGRVQCPNASASTSVCCMMQVSQYAGAERLMYAEALTMWEGLDDVGPAEGCLIALRSTCLRVLVPEAIRLPGMSCCNGV